MLDTISRNLEPMLNSPNPVAHPVERRFHKPIHNHRDKIGHSAPGGNQNIINDCFNPIDDSRPDGTNRGEYWLQDTIPQAL